jgi:uncharacterized protein (DUF488 family)
MHDNDSAIFTVGHSTRPITAFIELLQAHAVERLVDVRTMPRSRYNPQFNRETLSQSLAEAGIRYVHKPGLGGLRHTTAASPNKGWRNSSFRGYADYMQTAEFIASLDEIIALAGHERIALMCAEAVPWRCHRSLIADALIARGIPVEELVNVKQRQPHKLTSFAKVEGVRVTYPPEPPINGELF